MFNLNTCISSCLLWHTRAGRNRVPTLCTRKEGRTRTYSVYMYTQVYISNACTSHDGVATISRLLRNTGPFAKGPYKKDYILQKRPMFVRNLLIVATPYLLSRTRAGPERVPTLHRGAQEDKQAGRNSQKSAS